MKTHTKRSMFLTGVVVLIGALIAGGLYALKPTPERKEPEIFSPPVRVMVASARDEQVVISAQGAVQPRRQIDLVAQVGGRVIEVSDDLFDGQFFKEGQVLVRIDPRDYENALTRARADVASAEQRLALERAEADQAARDWESLGGKGSPPPLVLRKPQLAEAQANLDAARAGLKDAELNLQRTGIAVPFNGRVREKLVDIGQFVNPGQRLGTVYSTDAVEIPLPLTDRQASFLDLPLSPQQNMAPVPVTIKTTFTGKEITWDAVIRRTQGAIDPRSRVLVPIAQVEDPFNLRAGADTSKPPLAVGLFVEADIQGRSYSDIVSLPRTALRDGAQVITVNAENRLEFHDVEVLRTTANEVLLSSGIAPGERVLITALDAPLDGMEVDVIETMPAEPSVATAAQVMGMGGLQ